MGREIRRVPPDWQHPLLKDQHRYATPNGWDWTGQGRHFLPMHAHFSYNEAEVAEGLRDGWLSGEPPNYDVDVMPQWTAEEATHFQVYETVSEGTPVSPVFATREEIAEWLVDEQGYSREAAAAFAETGWAPSGASFKGHFYRDIEAAVIPTEGR